MRTGTTAQMVSAMQFVIVVTDGLHLEYALLVISTVDEKQKSAAVNWLELVGSIQRQGYDPAGFDRH